MLRNSLKHPKQIRTRENDHTNRNCDPEKERREKIQGILWDVKPNDETLGRTQELRKGQTQRLVCESLWTVPILANAGIVNTNTKEPGCKKESGETEVLFECSAHSGHGKGQEKK
ncbi:MAG: uncharacterized protein A8A55_2635 [Amphiamblys sp. WSBS2006]|nr:MAG: uncharacterized protein A8A55_2635 [Amphiamblys sp. WSBS2006]